MKREPYDYEELAATTVLLNISIATYNTPLSTSMDEPSFNADVDRLADRIKKLFTSIEDSGASHLRRTQAKAGLEALHYRLVYSVRTRPPPKKSMFGAHDGVGGGWQGDHRSSSFLEKFLKGKKGGDSGGGGDGQEQIQGQGDGQAQQIQGDGQKQIQGERQDGSKHRPLEFVDE